MGDCSTTGSARQNGGLIGRAITIPPQGLDEQTRQLKLRLARVKTSPVLLRNPKLGGIFVIYRRCVSQGQARRRLTI
jgi:hypothetical protein